MINNINKNEKGYKDKNKDGEPRFKGKSKIKIKKI
jgi:hypothetical protein